MMTNADLMRKIVNDVKVDFSDEFDRNFTRKAFFDKPWPKRRFGDSPLLIETGDLRKSLRARVSGDTVIWSSHLKYSAIQNEGGRIKVTAKRKRFFWAKYKEEKHEYWKAMALKKEGSYITIPARRFVGWHQSLNKNVQAIVGRRVKQFADELAKEINKKL